MLQQLRADFSELLQEKDTTRPLDSIEVMTLMSYCTRKGIDIQYNPSTLNTIEEWAQWAAPYFITT